MTDTAPATLPAIERTLELNAPPERVWRAITEPAELARWFPQHADWELRPGGRGTFSWDAHGEFEIRVEAVETERYLAWRWGEGSARTLEDSTPTTLVEWWLKRRPDGGTTLRVRETGFSRPDARAENEQGWAEELAELTTLLEARNAGR